MLLTETNMIHYLLGKGLADARSFVQGHYSCHSMQGRHRHFIINKGSAGRKLFIKQAPGGSAEKRAFLLKEGYFYELAFSNKKLEGLRSCLPTFLLLDTKDAVLALEYYSDHAGLDAWLHTEKDGKMIEQVAGQVAATLFSLHRIGPDHFDTEEEKDLFAASRPWVLDLAVIKREDYSPAGSEAERQSTELIFSISGFVELIGQAAKQWEPGSLIHGDCKLSNFLWKGGNTTDLKWVDCEMISSGDPLWDVATVFQSALTLWTIGNDPGFVSAGNRQKPDTGLLQLFLSSLWRQYAGCYQWDAATAKQKLEKCTRFTALRLLHACFETTPAADNLQPYSARLLQLAYNILVNPAKAATDLLGINDTGEK